MFIIKIPISPIIKETVFKHFCGGTNIKDSQKTIEFLWEIKHRNYFRLF